MKQLLVLACFLFYCGQTTAQSYSDEIAAWQRQYIREHLEDPNSPVKGADTAFLRFYGPDKTYRVAARFTPTPKARPFRIATHSGETRPYRCYGRLSFELLGVSYTLEVYQGQDLIKNPAYKDHLFLPFNDQTNNETTYGGGRYLDLKTGDIRNGRLTLDFNKAYNPYCAFGEGYSCPIPPDANKLPVRIEAGEQQYAKKLD